MTDKPIIVLELYIHKRMHEMLGPEKYKDLMIEQIADWGLIDLYRKIMSIPFEELPLHIGDSEKRPVRGALVAWRLENE